MEEINYYKKYLKYKIKYLELKDEIIGGKVKSKSSNNAHKILKAQRNLQNEHNKVKKQKEDNEEKSKCSTYGSNKNKCKQNNRCKVVEYVPGHPDCEPK